MNTPKTAYTKVFYGFLGIAYVSAFTLSIAGWLVDRWPIFFIFKALFMPCVSVFAYLSWQGERKSHYKLLQAAFLFAWLGDIILGLPRVHPIILTLGGFFFLLQHVFYIWLNVSTKGAKTNLLKTPYWGFPTIAYVLLFSLSYWSKADLLDKFFCSMYSTFLASSFYTSFFREKKTRANYWICILGFSLFVLSDMLIIIEQFIFVLSDWESSLILVTYYMAQSLICYAHVYDSNITSALQTT